MPSRQNGILIANYSLVLQHVRLNDAGHYSCQAENYIGATESNKHELMIKCKHNTVVDFTIRCPICILGESMPHQSAFRF
jgi:hypothetical protein